MALTDSDTLSSIRSFLSVFRSAYCFQAPEFTNTANLPYLKDMYRSNPKGIGSRATNPVNSSWYPKLIRGATENDIDTLDNLFTSFSPTPDRLFTAYGHFFFTQLCEESWTCDQKGATVSAAIPKWLRAHGFMAPEGGVTWRCERSVEVIAAEAATRQKQLESLTGEHQRSQDRLREIKDLIQALEKEAAAIEVTKQAIKREYNRIVATEEPNTFLVKY